MKILVLTAGYGSGHRQVSRVLQEKAPEFGAEVRIIDLNEQSHPRVDAMATALYRKQPWVYQQVYGWLYQKTKQNERLFDKISFFYGSGRDHLRRAIQDWEPNAIVSTFPFSTYKKLAINIPYFNLITDYYPHVQWLDHRCAGIFVGHEKMCDKKYPNMIVSGIPVRTSFLSSSENQQEEAQPCDQPDHVSNSEQKKQEKKVKNVVLMAHTIHHKRDLLWMIETIQRRFGERVQLQVVCGPDASLRRYIQTKIKHVSMHTHIHGYREDIHTLFRVSDLILTKPGGITVTEAMHTGTPMLFYRPMPGQEKENALFLQSNQAAFVAANRKEWERIIADILDQEDILEEYAKNVFSLKKENTLACIFEHIRDSQQPPCAADACTE